MSSPSSVGGNNGSVGIREGTRVILREITANLQNSPPGQSPRRKSGNEASPLKGEPQQQQQQQQHDVKVRFIREFADVGSTGREATAESSLSSASSFQSLASTLSSKCSSGICVDSSPGKAADTSYLSADIPGLDDLISACENIRLADTTVNLSKDQSFSLQLDAEDFSGDQTFASATDAVSPDRTREFLGNDSPTDFQLCAESADRVVSELERTRTFDAETEGSLANDLVECVNNDEVESTKYHEADSQFGSSVDATFVQCSSTVAPETAIVVSNAADEESNDRGKSDDFGEQLEIVSELVRGETGDLVGEKADQSQVKSLTGGTVDQSQAKSLTGETVDQSQAKGLTGEKFDRSETKSVADERQSQPTILTGERLDRSQPTTLAEIVEQLPQDTGTDISAEEAKRLILNDTIELSTPPLFDEAKRLIQLDETAELLSQLDKTIELSTPQFIDSVQKPTSDFESLSDVNVENTARSEFISGWKPTNLSDIEESSRSSTLPSLPTLSSICLRADLTESEIPAVPDSRDETHESAPSNDKSTASLSEKFALIVAQIAKDEVCTRNSISAVGEPTFLNSQKTADDSADSQENKSNDSIQNTDEIVTKKSPREQSSIEEIAAIQSRELEIETVETARESSEEVSRAPSVKQEVDLAVVKKEPEEPIVRGFVERREADSSASSDDLNATVTIQDISAGNLFTVPEVDQYAEFLPQQQSTGLVHDRRQFETNKPGPIAAAGSIIGDNLVSKPISVCDEYAAFVPQKQSTSLASCFGEIPSRLERQATPFVTALLPPDESQVNGDAPTSPKIPEHVDDRCNFAKLEIAANAVANDIYNKSLELEEENERFVSATGTDLFVDPGGFDFLLSKTPRKNTSRNLRTESLYVKFDPLVSNTSMLPQGNIHNTSPPPNEDRNGENNTTIANLGTPKQSPALAAIDRLLFYSPMANTPTTNTATIQKANEVQEKVEPTEETSAETVNMAKELELVRSTVIQLEDQLEKLKLDNEEKQTSYQEKINQLQAQLAQEIKNKNQITVVVDEYEKSISRLVAERERDRKNLDLEKAKLQEELAAAKHHLDNTEAAFNDVHLKYERLKAVVATYKSNEIALKESLQENVEIIKSLENRYEQVKSHATARLEKANQDLDAIRKQNESETVRLHAMLRKAELKSNSLAELVEQKTKENKELTQILDEVIARVGRNKSE